MTWLAFKKACKKVWTWVKHYWYVPAVGLYTLIMWSVFRKNADAGLGVLLATKTSYEEQIKEINRTHEEEIKKRNEVISQYNEVIEAVEKRYEEGNRSLTKEKKDRAKKIVNMYHEDPKEMAKILASVFGIEYEHYND